MVRTSRRYAPLSLVLLTGALLATAGCPRDTPSDAECGNGTVEAGEACDDGNTASGDGCSATCTTEGGSGVCGDGTLDAGEECDDGNTASGDGCSATCTTEGANPSCGDGNVDPGESCDDGNKVSGDGCENDCTVTNAVRECGTLAPIASGTCEVTAGTNGKVLISANILAPDGILEGGQVLVDEAGAIACVDCDCTAQAAGATQVVCPSGVVSPGLINAHDHIGWIGADPYFDSGERYEQRHDWRKGLRGHTKLSTPGAGSTDQKQWGELRFVMGGATSTDASGTSSGFLRNLDESNTYQEGLGQKPVHYETFPLGDSGGDQIEYGAGCGYPGKDTAASIAGDDSYVPHVAEGIDGVAENEFLCTSSTENGAVDLTQPQSAFIHAVGLSPADYALMAQEGTGLIWSPRSNVTLYGDTAKVTVAARAGVRIALGTDWMPTGSMNMLRELACADNLNRNYYGGFFTDREIWLMATGWAAELLAVDDATGSLKAGLAADIAIFDGSTHQGYRAVLDAQPQDVVLVMRGGTPLYGDSDVIDALASGCDAMGDVCGAQKSVCAQADLGRSFSALQGAVGSIYPLYFCGTPDNEPSCTPMRGETVNGSGLYTGAITADDTDGDGIANADDDCPTVFNPIRPNDNGVQADVDQDGLGDVCDPCPLDADTTQCSTVDPNDMDGDGIPAASDNCPGSANADQADADQDGKGDVCDPCPNEANPGSAACTVSIYDVKAGTATGTVGIQGAIVTACAPGAGFFVQVSESDPDYNGAENSAVYVYDHGDACAAGVQRGDEVTLNPATVNVWYQQIELTDPVVTVTAQGQTVPAPVALTPAQAAGTTPNGYEGVLATVSNVTVTDIAPTPGGGDSAPTGEYVVDGALRVDNFIYEISPFPVVGATYTSITGVLAFKNDNQKLEPRDAADYVVGAPVLVGLTPATAFTRVGAAGAATLPTPLEVVLSSAAQGDTTVTMTSSDPAALTVSDVVVPDGATRAQVPVTGVAQAQAVTVTATLDGASLTAAVRVVADTEVPAVVALDPATATVSAGGTASFAVTLDIPAPVGGTVVTLATTGGVGSVPATVTVPEDALSASFDLTAAAAAGTGTITATAGTGTATADVTVTEDVVGLVINEVDYDQPGTDAGEFVEIYNGSGTTVDLGALQLVMINGSNGSVYGTVDLGPGTLADGAFLVVVGTGPAPASIPATVQTINWGNSIQNGDPDAIVLVDTAAGKLVDVVSYGGPMTGVTVPGVGTVDLPDAGATDPGAGDIVRNADGT